MTALSYFALQQRYKTIPAKGALAFEPASLYWCGWNWASGPRRLRAFPQ
jgi:hypothetical protein